MFALALLLTFLPTRIGFSPEFAGLDFPERRSMADLRALSLRIAAGR